MPKDVLQNIYSNMYGEGKNFQTTKPSNTMKRLMAKKTEVNTQDKTQDMSQDKSPVYDMDIQPPSFTMWGIVVFTLILAIVSLIYYFRDTLLSYYHSAIDGVKEINPIQTLEKTLSETKEPEPAPNPTLTASTIQSEEREAEEKKKMEEKGAIRQLQNKLDTSLYRKDQMVKKDGFCYIGFEKGHRVCTDVYQGDVCMSGEIFPTMDVCLVPSLRP
jgi:hypothetical protein